VLELIFGRPAANTGIEDDYLIATDLAGFLEECGAEIAGLAGTVKDARNLVDREGGRLNGAVLDINLRDEWVYPVADLLALRGVHFVFVTGYDALVLPPAHASAPGFEKPVDKGRLAQLLLE
jgi:DNA-binding LytR/AlgR family response regulator